MADDIKSREIPKIRFQEMVEAKEILGKLEMLLEKRLANEEWMGVPDSNTADNLHMIQVGIAGLESEIGWYRDSNTVRAQSVWGD